MRPSWSCEIICVTTDIQLTCYYLLYYVSNDEGAQYVLYASFRSQEHHGWTNTSILYMSINFIIDVGTVVYLLVYMYMVCVILFNFNGYSQQ